MERGELFRKTLGIRTLVSSAVELDQRIIHYIAYDFTTNVFEITISAQAQTNPIPYWVFKIELPHTLLERFLKLIAKMISHYDKVWETKEKKHVPTIIKPR